MTDTAETTAAPAVAPPSGSKIKRLAAIGIGIAVLGGGAFWWISRRPAAHVEPAATAASRGLVPFETFVVNLADGGGTRFLRVTLQLVVSSPEIAEHLAKSPVLVMQGRSAILELLAQQTAETLVTPKGKDVLKQAIAERAVKALDGAQVVDVLFSEFVVQF